jgi:hypothetical protein
VIVVVLSVVVRTVVEISPLIVLSMEVKTAMNTHGQKPALMVNIKRVGTGQNHRPPVIMEITVIVANNTSIEWIRSSL